MGFISLQDSRYFQNSKTLDKTLKDCHKLFLGGDIDIHIVMKKGDMTTNNELIAFEGIDTLDTFCGFSKEGAYQIYNISDIKIAKISLV